MEKFCVFMVAIAFMFVSTGQASPTTFMDATHHNGALTAGTIGYWSDPAAIPAGWVQTAATAYTAGGGTVKWTMITGGGSVVNNTGELFLANQQYTIQADLGGFDTYPATVKVYATQNADGTGNKALLASLSRMGNNSVDGYSLFTVSSTGAGIGSSYSGYFIQVALEGSGYYDNIVVTSDVATSMTIMNATIHNGSLTATAAGNWTTPAALPAGWAESLAGSAYQAGGGLWSMISTPYCAAYNNTGELVLANYRYTVSASLGGTAGSKAVVRVFATQNINGTGAKVLLAEVSRLNGSGQGYNVYPTTGTAGSATTSNLAGYYVQVVFYGASVGYYDNIGVIAEQVPGPIPNVYMSADFHNGVLTAQGAGFWWDVMGDVPNPIATPTGWIETSLAVYTAGVDSLPPLRPGDTYTNCGSTATATNNTGELVPASHAFKISADLGGYENVTAKVRVYATEHIDGTGYKFLLAEASRLNGSGQGYGLYPVTGTPGTPSAMRLDGYYVQVVLGGVNGGFYDNIVVTSEEVPAPTNATYMDEGFHNGAMNSPDTGGEWSDPCYVSLEWVAAGDANNIYTASSGFILFDGHGQTLINNTGEVVPANHQFTIQADLGGATGGTAQAFVYATENVDGTGDKVLLAEVSRPGNTADGYTLFTVSSTGSSTGLSIEGYYVQVVLKTLGDINGDGNCYYDHILVTSELVVGAACGDAGHPYPIGDLSKDCYVDFEDINIFAGQWLGSGCLAPDWCGGADLSHDASVKFDDFAAIAAQWLTCTDPNAPCSYNP